MSKIRICEEGRPALGKDCSVCHSPITLGDEYTHHGGEYFHAHCEMTVPRARDHLSVKHRQSTDSNSISPDRRYHGPSHRDDI